MNNEKTIGIITYHSANNYGAMLQAYALQKALQKNFKDVYIIDYRNKKIENNYKIFKFSGKNPVRLAKQLMNNLNNLPSKIKRKKKFLKFKNTYMSLSKKSYKTEKELKDNPPQYDIYITGSDQVWSTHITGRLEDAYTLNFGNDKVKRISYAVSIGKDKIEEKYVKDYQKKISKIEYISVREKTAQEELDKIINNDIQVVLDPTLLISKEEWDDIEKESEEIVKEDYILVYELIQDEKVNKIVEFLKSKTHFKVVSLKSISVNGEIYKNEYATGPIEFISLIKHAKYVITNSFHGTIFSILYEKEFIVTLPNNTGIRIENLLEELELKEKIIYQDSDILKIKLENNIDYKKVRKILEEKRKQSMLFLSKSIEN